MGACLGLGLTSMGSADPVVYEDLKNTLFQDSAVSGELIVVGGSWRCFSHGRRGRWIRHGVGHDGLG